MQNIFPKFIHLIGIGGDGMTSLTGMLLNKGVKLSGSDQNDKSLTKQKKLLSLFKRKGVSIFYGHSCDNLSPRVGLVIRSSAIPKDNPEIIEAKKRGIPIIKRSRALGRLMVGKKGIAVTGAAGKSTTVAMLGEILEDSGLDPTVYLGGVVPNWKANFRVGDGKYFVCEADEYDRSFLDLHFQLAIITNLFWGDHADCYSTFNDEKRAFRKFINILPKKGLLFLNADDLESSLLSVRKDIRVIRVGFSDQSDFKIILKGKNLNKTKFEISQKDHNYTIELNIPGKHNLYNAAMAFAVAMSLGVDPQKAIRSLAKYKNIGRRLEFIGEKKRIAIIDDYAHNPEQINASRLALEQWFPNRKIISLFQPRQYKRTRILLKDFAQALSKFNSVVITDISKGLGDTELDIRSISSRKLVKLVSGYGMSADYGGDLENSLRKVVAKLRKGEVLLTMGTNHELNVIAKRIFSYI